MESALLILRHILMSTGMSQDEADKLLALFLQQEAFEYVECMKLMTEDPERFEKLTEPKYDA